MKTLVIGASTKPERYSYKAANLLTEYGHEVELLGKREGMLVGKPIHTEMVPFTNIHTVTMYVGPQNQQEYYDYIISLNPKRVIFNPGTENAEFEQMLQKHNIEAEEACTLILLRTNQF